MATTGDGQAGDDKAGGPQIRRVGVIGGTGPAGRALAARLAASGLEVHLGSRSPERAEEVVAELRDRWSGRDLRMHGVANLDAAGADIVVLATPFEAAAETAAGLADALSGRVVVSMVNALTRVGRELHALVPALGSVAATVQSVLPRSEVTAAFQHLPAKHLGDLDHELVADVLVCAPSPRSATETAALVESVPGLRAVKAGSLASAGPVEALTAVLVNVNIRYRAHVAVRLEGLRAGDA
jgi:NADPH-dependent F420 reductase